MAVLASRKRIAMNGGVAIFVKTPGRSALKTRLAADRGEAYASGWYRRAAAAVASVARQAQARHGLVAYWAVAEADARDAWPDLPTLAQGAGGLGERMARVHAQLVERHGFGLLLGADSPQLTAELLGEAMDWLAASAPRLLLGPASDGGFWIFGGNHALPVVRWTGVAYSTADTAARLRDSLCDAGDWRTLPTLTDVDHASDLPAVRDALQRLQNPTPEQRALAAWMDRHEDSPHA